MESKLVCTRDKDDIGEPVDSKGLVFCVGSITNYWCNTVINVRITRSDITLFAKNLIGFVRLKLFTYVCVAF